MREWLQSSAWKATRREKMKRFREALVSGELLIPAYAIVAVPEIPLKVSPGVFSLQNLNSILLDPRYVNATDSDGQTLVPPTLSEFIYTFQEDLETTFGLQIPVQSSEIATEGSIFITLSNDTAKFRDAAGRATSEGYQLEIGEAVTISGASPLGAWLGTRSVLQLAVLNEKKLSYGIATDSPGWAILDAGRHYYPPNFIQELCSYLSFFKQNTLQLHMSDNPNNYQEQTLNLYSAFRPWSDDPALAGLSPLKNESYSRQDLEDMQRACAARGVTIVPEIEAPGHALSIVKWKPQLGLEDMIMLNISHPETIPAVKMIWSTFLSWFHSKTVHIGADEYDKRHIRDYARFVNEIAEHILSESGKKVRIWGTFTPSQGSNVSKNVMQQHWANYDDNAYWDFIKNGYQVLNAYNYFYIVNKWSATYMPPLSQSKAFTSSPSHGQFSPNIFDVTNVANNPLRSDPNVHGHLVCL
ncbi:Beta-hexosaminidase subunit A1 [Beauveria bassiana D1-5]|uniref:beta-N-acetylhexosaminidase n=1 Tax=Beauveria bassiana D1-5 TaxID=1245745 RepID=A0A0A2VCL8_BEABA|nr:Beta-hexosaminidase subunit A1 [Beauveria bassiana D1-5]